MHTYTHARNPPPPPPPHTHTQSIHTKHTNGRKRAYVCEKEKKLEKGIGTETDAHDFIAPTITKSAAHAVNTHIIHEIMYPPSP